MISPSAPPPVKPRVRYSDILVLLVVAAVAAGSLANVYSNMSAAGVKPGFGFLVQEAGFDVSEALIPYQVGDSYTRVILAGLTNTLFLASVCLVLATVIGVLFGLISVGPSPVGRWLALGYVELFRNLPKLLLLLVVYVTAVNGLPPVRQAISFGPIHLSNRSINFPVPVFEPGLWIPLLAMFVGFAIWAGLRWTRSMSVFNVLPSCLCHPLVWLAGLPCFSMLVFGASFGVSIPELKGFDFHGGGRVSLQFAVIAATLGIYHGAQIAEVVRGGLQAIPKGQGEAAEALGLSRAQTIRLVILPQVIRIIVPPMNNQYVNLIKNTSIAIAVGYSDLMSVSGTIINQTFKAFEMMLVTMGLYLVICVSVTALLNQFHHQLTARERR